MEKNKIIDLRKKINKWNYEYYVLDNPTVDDIVYNLAMKELIELENKFPNLVTENSPTQKIGGKVVEKFEKFTHIKPMMSLNNAFNEKDLRHFDDQIFKLLGHRKFTYSCELKIDGVSISIHYKNGKIDKAITRGDGIQGEVVTSNVVTIKSLPKEIKYMDDLEIRGEVFISNNQFKKINNERKINDEPLMANPRNTAAGALRQLDSSVAYSRNLDIFLYFWMNDDVVTQNESFKKLSENKFKINKENKILNSIDSVIKYCYEYEKNRYNLNYEIDGVVIKINEMNYYEEIGLTSKFPKWAIAFKFKAETSKTKLLDIIPTVGRTGRITYNARLKPIKIMGTVVQKATLHNANYINDLDIRIGDYVNIKKAGDIIPKVLNPIIAKRNNNLLKWKKHTNCPSCNSILVNHEGEVDQYCLNSTCKDRVLQSIIHFSSKNAMNIEGLGNRILEIFIEKNIIAKISDIYKIENKKEDVIKIDGFGEKSFNKLVDSINKSKILSNDRILFGLGIRYIGKKVSKQICNKYKSIDKIISLSRDEINSGYDIGPRIADSLINYFSEKENIELINELKSLGVQFNGMKIVDIISNPFMGKTFVLTGSLSTTREEMKLNLEKLGVNIVSSISKNVDYLLIGDSPGSKLEKAQKINIPIVNEKDINKYLK